MNIPKEICNFFKIEEGQTLLIKGLPGTGKTTLALEIMSALCDEKNGMYVSTRVDPNRLHHTFPWISEIVPINNIINATQSKLIKSLNGLTSDGSTTYDTVIEFFKIFFEEAEEMDNPMIVIDSWDAVMNYTSQILGKAQQSFEQNICEFARDLGVHLIFVSEYDHLMPLDYIVDGVVTMEYFKLVGGGDHSRETRSSGMRTRYAREIRLDKLRGVEIGQKSYTCTLHGGRFQYFQPQEEATDTRIGGEMMRIPDPKENSISTGIGDLDQIIGGFKLGSCNVIEIEHGVGKRYYHILTALAANALKNGRGVCILPSIGYQLSIRDIFVPANVCVAQPNGDDLKEWGKRLMENWDELREKTGRPILNIIGMDTIEFAFSYKDLLNVTNKLMQKWKETNDITLLVVKTGQESIKMAVHAADTYMVVGELNGGICIYGVIPRTPPYHMAQLGKNNIKLTPIV